MGFWNVEEKLFDGDLGLGDALKEEVKVIPELETRSHFMFE